jgi:hypothetical protein
VRSRDRWLLFVPVLSSTSAVGAALLAFRATLGRDLSPGLGCSLAALITVLVAGTLMLATPGGRRSFDDLRQLFGAKNKAAAS